MSRKVQNLAQVFRSAVMFAHSVGSSDGRRWRIGHLIFADFQFGRIGLSERSDLVMLLKLPLSSCSIPATRLPRFKVTLSGSCDASPCCHGSAYRDGSINHVTLELPYFNFCEDLGSITIGTDDGSVAI
ncbi:hypothetical protein M422DRAFT_37380, partial [Sphaerobolus stellatus SS14]